GLLPWPSARFCSCTFSNGRGYHWTPPFAKMAKDGISVWFDSGNVYAAVAVLGRGSGTCTLTVVPQYSSNSLVLAVLTIVSPSCLIPELTFSLDVMDASSRSAMAR